MSDEIATGPRQRRIRGGSLNYSRGNRQNLRAKESGSASPRELKRSRRLVDSSESSEAEDEDERPDAAQALNLRRSFQNKRLASSHPISMATYFRFQDSGKSSDEFFSSFERSLENAQDYDSDALANDEESTFALEDISHFEDSIHSLFEEQDYMEARLKDDHTSRPIWICDDGKILLESFSPIAEYAQDFLIAIAEPISRPEFIHEYQLTEYSLYAAVSVGLETDSIIEVLNRLSKIPVSQTISEFIKQYTLQYGKVKMILKQNRYFVESIFEDVLLKLCEDQVIRDSRIGGSDQGLLVEPANTGVKFDWTKIQNNSTKYSERATEVASQSITANNQKQSNGIINQDQIYSSTEILNLFPESPLSTDNHSTQLAEENDHPIYFEDKNVTQTSIDEVNDDWDLNFDFDMEEDPFGDILNSDSQITSITQNIETPTIPIQRDEFDEFDDIGMDEQDLVDALTKDPTLGENMSYSFEIDASKNEDVRKRCGELNYPMLEEYDFRNDPRNPKIDIDLKPSTRLRPYQEKSLSKMFGNGRARSGIIVLPCGAGKTLVGVTAACTIRKSCLVLCTSSVSVEQWAREFRTWSTAKDGQVARFTSDLKEKFTGDSGILISTYTMVTFSGKRAYDAQKMMDFIRNREWGFLLLDEVHVVPSEMFRKVLTIVAAHAKLGLTATLVREDEKIENLNYLIGPKLYEANWMDLAQQGHIANVMCAEVWCKMTPEFYREYIHEDSRKRQLLYVMNPKKVQACQYLIEYHESCGDKIIIFSDNVFALKHYSMKLNRPHIYGGTSQSERLRILQQFRHNPALNTIFLSKVGDTSIDIPEANCLIQISSHYGSRRQEAQRLGRILRAKKKTNSEYNAYFYSLVSKDTEEMFYAAKRQQFLVDQGYFFKIITQIEGLDILPNLAYATRESQLELLNTVLVSVTQKDIEDADILPADDMLTLVATLSSASGSSIFKPAQRIAGSLKSLSGADSMAYMEYSKNSSKNDPVFKRYKPFKK